MAASIPAVGKRVRRSARAISSFFVELYLVRKQLKDIQAILSPYRDQTRAIDAEMVAASTSPGSEDVELQP
jgi:hypothetical protein